MQVYFIATSKKQNKIQEGKRKHVRVMKGKEGLLLGGRGFGLKNCILIWNTSMSEKKGNAAIVQLVNFVIN